MMGVPQCRFLIHFRPSHLYFLKSSVEESTVHQSNGCYLLDPRVLPSRPRGPMREVADRKETIKTMAKEENGEEISEQTSHGVPNRPALTVPVGAVAPRLLRRRPLLLILCLLILFSPAIPAEASPEIEAVPETSGSPPRCSHGEAAPSSPSSSPGDLDPPQEVVLKAISEVSKSEGRVSQTTNVVMGGTVADDSTNEWVALDQKVNSYPTVRGFTAIGTGGDDFVHSMVVAVESVLQQPIPEGHVTHKLSSRGKYVSVNIGPIRVISSEQVQAIYNAMRRDDRMKYFL